jgi:hypothetical protein
MRRLFVTLPIGLAACGACDASGLASGAIRATLDGAAWDGGETTWSLAGDSVQILSASTGDWWMSAIVQETDSGALAGDALGDLPQTFDLSAEAIGGFATFYPAAGESYSTRQASGGTLTIDAQNGDDLLGCFAFTAANAAGDEVVVKSGLFRAIAR